MKYESREVVERIKADLKVRKCSRILVSDDLYQECMEHIEDGPLRAVGFKKDESCPDRRLLINGVLAVRNYSLERLDYALVVSSGGISEKGRMEACDLIRDIAAKVPRDERFTISQPCFAPGDTGTIRTHLDYLVGDVSKIATVAIDVQVSEFVDQEDKIGYWTMKLRKAEVDLSSFIKAHDTKIKKERAEMEKITSHKVGDLNDLLDIKVIDRPVDGGTSHRYVIYSPNDAYNEELNASIAFYIDFQKGPVKEAGVNGSSVEALLAVVDHHLRGFQTGRFHCHENEMAIDKIQEAMMWLQRRTRDRIARGVEGKNEV